MTRSAAAVANLSQAVAGYASRLHKAAGGGHSVSSALGVWLLLALSSDTVDERDGAGLVALLGMPLDEAKDLAVTLIDRPHPQVASALAAWTRATHETPALWTWLETLPNRMDHGLVPSQAAADGWAAKRTDGLITQFPVTVDDDTLLVLASALATRVEWLEPLDVASVESSPGGAASWRSNVTTVLRSPPHARRYICAAAPDVGDLAVHEAHADGLIVVSVAATPEANQQRVLDAAHKLAMAAAGPWTGDSALPRRSLFDLELGRHPCWFLTESQGQVTSTTGREERVEAFLPAWQAETNLDLLSEPQLGVAPALNGLNRMLVPDPRGFVLSAGQTAKASFSRTGFTAAAVTAFAAMAGGLPAAPRDGVRAPDGPWHGVPVFSAWVTEAVEASG